MSNEEIVSLIQKGIDEKKNLELLYFQNIGLINSICKHFKGYAEYDDLHQEGFIALATASQSFNPLNECRFSTYAYLIIKQELYKYILRTGLVIRVPDLIQQKIKELEKIEQYFYLEYNRTPTDKELVYRLRVTPSQLSQIRDGIKAKNIQSLYDSDNEDSELIDTLKIDSNIDEYIEESSTKELNKELWDSVDSLGPQYSSIIKEKYINNKSTLSISKEQGVASSTIKSREIKAYKTLKTRLTDNTLYSNWLHINFYRQTGHNSFKRNGSSSVERIVLGIGNHSN